MNALHIEADYAYMESYIPPRCRKPRQREIRGTCTVTIPSITADEAPVAMRHFNCWPRTICDYRWFGEHLYIRAPYSSYLSNAEGWYPLEELLKHFRKRCFSPWEMGIDEADCITKCQDSADEFLVIDGDQVWVRKGEPRYVIATFGLGHNHASTDLMIQNYYNGNIRGDYYFNALDRDKAVERCVSVAIARGDTDSVDRIRRSDIIEVLMPETVRCNPDVEAGPGDSFLNMLDSLTATAGSQCEAAALVIAATGSEIKK